MKPQMGKQRRRAMTFFEVLFIVACLVIVVALLLPVLSGAKRATQRISCVSNLKQINLAFRIWEGDNNNQYPMAVSVTNGGAMESIEIGKLVSCFQVASNEMSTTKILVCPNDTARTFATNWNDLNRSHISYFIGADVSNAANPEMVLDGDDNLAMADKRLTSGLVAISSNSPVFWFGRRHGDCGNLGLVDGSVWEESQNGLQQLFQGDGLATNRIVIP
jgi:type II secretory pathway pseudopilin PulG